MTHSPLKTVAVANEAVILGAVVVPEHLLVQTAKKVERFNVYIRSLKSALEQPPEVCESVGVNLPSCVSSILLPSSNWGREPEQASGLRLPLTSRHSVAKKRKGNAGKPNLG
jgi:hypothetical protein